MTLWQKIQAKFRNVFAIVFSNEKELKLLDQLIKNIKIK